MVHSKAQFPARQDALHICKSQSLFSKVDTWVREAYKQMICYSYCKRDEFNLFTDSQ